MSSRRMCYKVPSLPGLYGVEGSGCTAANNEDGEIRGSEGQRVRKGSRTTSEPVLARARHMLPLLESRRRS